MAGPGEIGYAGLKSHPTLIDEKAQRVVAEIRRAYNYYQHMEPQASQAQVIPDWLVGHFAIAGPPVECRSRVEAL